MAKTRTKFKELLGKITFGNGTDIIGSEPTKNTVSESITGQNLFDYLIKGVNFTWLKIKNLFSVSNTNDGYLPKIDDVNKKLVKSNIQDDGTTLKYGTNTIWHSGNDGSTSGLDADLLDGKHASNFENSSISLSSGTDLNTLNSGKYHTFSSAIIASLLNCPVNTGELNLIVYNSGLSSYVFQELYSITLKTVYQRTNNGGTWSVWQKAWNSNNDGSGSGLDADLLDGKHASEFATSTHNHDGIYSTTDTKNTAGATDTSSKIYLVGSTEQTVNPQTYTHDTAYVGVDGNLYSGNSKTITNSDLETNQIVTPTLNPTWTIRNYAGTVISSPTNPSGEAINGTSIVLEYGFKPSMTVKGKWVAQAGYDNPTSCSGLCGTSLPASNVETAATSSIDLYNSTTYSSTTVPITTSAYWTIFTPKKGITVSGSSLVLPIGNISASARTQVTYQLPVYYGNVGSLTITEAIVEALSTKIWKNYQANSKSLSSTINSSDSEYWIYAYPAAWGDLTTISNADGDWIAAFTSSTVNITGAPGLTVVYNYYITVNKGAFKNKIINFS